MQDIWNQMVRWVFWLAVEWPMKIARMAYRGSEGTAKVAVKGAQAARATQDTAEDEPNGSGAAPEQQNHGQTGQAVRPEAQNGGLGEEVHAGNAALANCGNNP